MKSISPIASQEDDEMKNTIFLHWDFQWLRLCEKERGIRFDEVGDFSGPYPSGDTCIVLDVAARMGEEMLFFGRGRR